jgi:predicted nucleic acid-binding protein
VSGFLIDTNVISEFVRPRPDLQVIQWLEMTDPELLFASVVTFGDLREPGSRRSESSCDNALRRG